MVLVSCGVLAQMLSDCVCVHSWIAWWCGGWKNLLLRLKGASARSVEPGVLFDDFGAVERGRRVLRKRGMLVCMANGGRYCERSWQMCSVVTRLQVRVVAPTRLNALESTDVAGWELCAGNSIGIFSLDSVLSRLC